MSRLWRAWGRLARWRIACLLGLICASLVVSAGAALFYGPPAPTYHDEFSNLLAAQTFAAGRLSNPTHPLWQHFESMHILQVPTYQSKFPPAQGLVLALGLLLVDEPIAGVWLSAALLVAAIYWMLLAWTSPRWALLGGVLGLLRFGLWGPWTQSYWGAAVAGLGGALVFGGLGWMRRRDHPLDGAWLGLGLALLANSRPYEGLGLGLPTTLAVLGWALRLPPAGRTRRLLRALAPTVLLLGLGLGFAALHNHQVTGDPLLPPFLLYERSYATTSLPLFDFFGGGAEPNSVAYRHQELARFAEQDNAASPALQGPREIPYFLSKRIHGVWSGALRPYFLPLGSGFVVLLPLLLRYRRLRLAVVTAAFGVLVLMMPTWRAERHFAPFAGISVLLVISAVRILASARLGRPLAHRWIPASFVLLSLAVAAWQALGAGRSPQLAAASWSHQRQQLEQRLARSGRHLIIVRYPADHVVHQEWVYNAADIDAAAVVWARDMGPARNAELRAYFADRRAWRLVPPPEFQGVPTPVPDDERGAMTLPGDLDPGSPAP